MANRNNNSTILRHFHHYLLVFPNAMFWNHIQIVLNPNTNDTDQLIHFNSLHSPLTSRLMNYSHPSTFLIYKILDCKTTTIDFKTYTNSFLSISFNFDVLFIIKSSRISSPLATKQM